mmetsp:Transcript_8200/g.24554  ORF Transcript_8200/g.24554 Transcript_8200/m.24554 type:complete len:245 (-) Transcript_8200:1181-1915(-)
MTETAPATAKTETAAPGLRSIPHRPRVGIRCRPTDHPPGSRSRRTSRLPWAHPSPPRRSQRHCYSCNCRCRCYCCRCSPTTIAAPRGQSRSWSRFSVLRPRLSLSSRRRLWLCRWRRLPRPSQMIRCHCGRRKRRRRRRRRRGGGTTGRSRSSPQLHRRRRRRRLSPYPRPLPKRTTPPASGPRGRSRRDSRCRPHSRHRCFDNRISRLGCRPPSHSATTPPVPWLRRCSPRHPHHRESSCCCR